MVARVSPWFGVGVFLAICLGAPLDVARAQGIPQRVAELEARLAALEAGSAPAAVSVDCGVGQTVNGALAATAGARAVEIIVIGTCIESVFIARDDVSIEGATVSSGIEAPTPSMNAIVVVGSRIGINDLTVTAGAMGIGVAVATSGAAVLNNVQVTGGNQGISVFGGNAIVVGGTISGHVLAGIGVRGGGMAQINGTIINGGGATFGISVDGGSAVVISTTIASHNNAAINVQNGGNVRVQGSTLQNGARGIALQDGSVDISSSTVSGHTGDGIVGASSKITLRGTTIENNTFMGVRAFAGSTVLIGANGQPSAPPTRIRQNGLHGIDLSDTSVLGGVPSIGTVQIDNNGGWGIFCAPPPAVAQIQKSGASYVITATHVFANGSGQISCPGF